MTVTTTPSGLRPGDRVRYDDDLADVQIYTILGLADHGLRVDLGLGYTIAYHQVALVVEADTTDPCFHCGQILAAHPDPHPYHVDGQVVGNAQCAQLLHIRLHQSQVVSVKACCGELLGELCDCDRVGIIRAEAHRAPSIRIGAKV